MSKNILKKRPINGGIKVTSYYGKRNTGIAGASTFHRGFDLGGEGIKIFATNSGKITQVGYNRVRGYYVELRINSTYRVFYQHLKKGSIRVKKGNTVKAGKRIATKGATGLPGMSAHLHLEIRKNGKPINPISFFIGSFKSVNLKHDLYEKSPWLLEIKRLQENLKKMNLYKGKVDGSYGKNTKSAVKKFQKKYKLSADGSFGSKSRKKMIKLGYK